MAIQMRRGDYKKFVPSKLLDAEWAIVQENDPNASDGMAAYIAFKNGTVKRMATYEDMVDDVANALVEGNQDLIDKLTADVNTATDNANSATKSANSAASAANTAASSANSAANKASSAATSATNAATSANTAAGAASSAASAANTAASSANSAADSANDAAEKALGSITQDGFYFSWQQEGSDYRLVLNYPDPA